MDSRLLAAWNAGHFWNPAKPNLFNVDFSSLAKLDINHPIAREAIQSWQEADANYDILYRSQRFARLARGGNASVVAEEWATVNPPYDGYLDPATDTLIALKRCGMPDHPPPPHIDITSTHPELQAAIRSMPFGRGTGTGSWQAPGCDIELPESHKQYHSIVVQLDISNAPSRWKDPEYGMKALEIVRAGYAEMGLLVRYDLEKKYAKPQIRKLFTSLWGSVIGWNEFPPSSGSCNVTINGRLDTGFIPSDWRLWANLEFHETGHGVGEGHTRGGPMNPSILLIWPLTWKGSPSEVSLRRSFGGIPVSLPEKVLTWSDFLAI